MVHSVLSALLAVTLGGPAPVASADTKAPQIPVIIQTSEVASLLYFAEAVVDVPGHTSILKDIYGRHALADTLLVSGIREAFESVTELRFYERQKNLPRERKFLQNVTDLLEIAAAQSHDLDDFGRRTVGLLPRGMSSRLMRGLRALEPIHRDYVWKPSLDLLMKDEQALNAVAETINAGALLGRIAAFLGSAWPPGEPVTIVLVPVPPPYVSHTNFAHCANAYGFVEVLENDDMANRYGTLIHEIVHSLYHAQSLELQRSFEQWFAGNKSPAAPLAYKLIGEGLATAIGNGHVTTLVKGTPREQWYSDPFIDGFGKALYPLVKEYLEKGRTLDAAFVGQAISLFASRFPNLDRRPNAMFKDLVLIVDGQFDLSTIANTVATKVEVQKLQRSAPTEHPKTMASYERAKDMNCLFVVARENLDQLGAYPFAPEVIPRLKQGPTKPFYLAVKVADRTHVFLVIGSKEASIEAVGDLVGRPELVMDQVTTL